MHNRIGNKTIYKETIVILKNTHVICHVRICMHHSTQQDNKW